jgi:hypothetical protein
VQRLNVAKYEAQDVFEKALDHGWVLRKIAHAELGAPAGKGCYWDEHELVHPASGESVGYRDWEWAEADGKRLVWAARGKLFAGWMKKTSMVNETELYDFNEMRFEAVEAPY